MSYAKLVEEDRKLAILRLLSESNDYKANEYLLQSALDGVGHAVSGDRLRADLAWLADSGLLEIELVAGVQVPKLSARGLDVAQGRVHHPGVKRPRPGG
jgi:hypothetical protein